MRARPTIFSRLVVLGLAVALPFVGILGWTLYGRFRSDRDNTLAELRLLRRVNERQVRTYIETTRFKLQQLASEPQIQSSDPARIDEFFRGFLRFHPEYLNLAYLDLDGRVTAAANIRPAPETSLATTSPYREAMQSPTFVISPPFVREPSHTWACLAAQPVVNARGERVGTLALPLNLGELSTSVLTLPPGLSTSTVSLVDERGHIVAREPASGLHPGQIGPEFEALTRLLGPFSSDRMSGQSIDDAGRTISVTRIAGSPWLLSTSVATDEILHRAWGNLWRALAAIIGFLTLGALIIARYARTLAEPITAFADAARAQAAGQTDALAPVDGPAEIAATAEAFNEMVAARHRAETAVRASEERFRIMADSAPVLIWTAGPDGSVNFLNESWLAFTGRTLDQEAGTGWADGIHPEDHDRALELYQTYFAQSAAFVLEYRLRRHDGEYRLLLDHGKPLFNAGGEFLGFIGVCVDLTDLRRAEQERQHLQKNIQETQKLESLGVLAGGIAHDFNNLLTGILGYASLARLDDALPGPTAQYLAQIERSSLRAADLCKQMLAYAGKGRFVIQHLDLNALVDDTTQLLRVSVSKKATLRFALSSQPTPIQGDPTQLRQLVMNLVINASEAIGERPGHITIATGIVHADADYLTRTHFARDLPPGDYCFVEVADDGAGMDRETIGRIFDPFFTTKFAGRGLGLAAVLGIVRGHQGAINVFSEPGRGTTFKVLFPVGTGAPEAIRNAPGSARSWKGSGTLLVADDEESVRLVLVEMLGSLGFSVEHAHDGRVALELFRANPERYVAVLLDLTMPEMDGEEAFRQLRALSPAVKVLLMSGFNEQEAVRSFVGKGLAGFVQKPFSIDALSIELRRVVGRTL